MVFPIKTKTRKVNVNVKVPFVRCKNVYSALSTRKIDRT